MLFQWFWSELSHFHGVLGLKNTFWWPNDIKNMFSNLKLTLDDVTKRWNIIEIMIESKLSLKSQKFILFGYFWLTECYWLKIWSQESIKWLSWLKNFRKTLKGPPPNFFDHWTPRSWSNCFFVKSIFFTFFKKFDFENFGFLKDF